MKLCHYPLSLGRVEEKVEGAGGVTLEWRDFAELPAPLLYGVLRLRQQVFVVEQRCAYPDLDGRDQTARHLLLRADGGLAGYLRLMPAEGRVAIGRLAVDPEIRRRGFGRRLMEEALARCGREWPDCAIVLSAQTYLVRFYESLGFRIVSEPYDDYGLPHVDMLRSPAQ